jgi:GTPase SAR1 family protein
MTMPTENFDWPSCKVLYTGNSGSGKTTLLEKTVKKEKARWKFVYDHKHGEFCKRFGTTPCFDGADLDEALERGGFVVFDPIHSFKGKPEEGFSFWCKWVQAICENSKGRKLFICDELQKLMDTRNEPDDLITILDTGRVYQIDCYMITNASNGIHNRVRQQITEVYAFKQGDKNACEWLEQKGFDREKLLTMPKFKYVWKNLDTGETREGG